MEFQIGSSQTDCGIMQAAADCVEIYAIPSCWKGLPVTLIGPRAFAYSRAKRIILPPSIRIISSGAFSHCAQLERIILPGELVSLQSGAFDCCTALKHISVPGGVEELTENCFAYCTALEQVDLPKGLKRIACGVFRECAALKMIRFSGTVAQWKQVRKDPCWDQGAGQYTVFCSDGFIPQK